MQTCQSALSALDAWVESYKAPPAPPDPQLHRRAPPPPRAQGGAAPAGGEDARYDEHRAPGTTTASGAVASSNAATAPVPHSNSLRFAVHGDSLKDRLAHKLRMLEEEHAMRTVVAASAAKRGVRGEQGKDEAWEALARNRIAGERKTAAEREAEMNEVRAQWEDHITRRLGPDGKSTDSPSPDAEMDELRALRAKWEGQITGSFSRANLSLKSTEDAKIQPGTGLHVINRVCKDASVESKVVKMERPKLAASTPRSRQTTGTMDLADLIATGDPSVSMAVHPSFKVH